MAAAITAVNFYAATNSPASCDLSNFNRAAAAKELRRLRCSYVFVCVSAPENLTLFQNCVILLKKDFFRAASQRK